MFSAASNETSALHSCIKSFNWQSYRSSHFELHTVSAALEFSLNSTTWSIQEYLIVTKFLYGHRRGGVRKKTASWSFCILDLTVPVCDVHFWWRQHANLFPFSDDLNLSQPNIFSDLAYFVDSEQHKFEYMLYTVGQIQTHSTVQIHLCLWTRELLQRHPECHFKDPFMSLRFPLFCSCLALPC